MTDVLIKRELLEELADFARGITESEARAILAAPRQPDGGHGWLVSLELPEVQCNCAWNPDSHDKTCPVYLRDRMADAQRAIAELRGLTPELPPRPPEGEGMPRYGLRWNGPQQPVAVPMADGYWTPWHLAEAEYDTLRHQRNKLADLLKRAHGFTSADSSLLYEEIRAVLEEVQP